MKKTILMLLFAIIPLCGMSQIRGYSTVVAHFPEASSHASIKYVIEKGKYGFRLLMSSSSKYYKFDSTSKLVMRIDEEVVTLPPYDLAPNNYYRKTSYGDVLFFSEMHFEIPNDIARKIAEKEVNISKIRIIFADSYSDYELKPKYQPKFSAKLRESYSEALSDYVRNLDKQKEIERTSIRNATDGF